jgi:ankyrin repeat protein/Tol biopolymer transport system component
MISTRRLICFSLATLLHFSHSYPLEIHEAVKNRDLARAESLLSRSPAWANVQDEDGMTPLHLSAALGDIRMAGLLISRGASVDSKSNFGHAPLHTACFRGHAEMVKALLAHGADINEPDFFGETILSRMAQRGEIEFTELLLGSGAEVNVKNSLGISPVFWAIHSGKLRIVKLLIENGANLKDQMNDRTSLLHLAVTKEKAPIAKFLIKSGLDVDVTNEYGVTPLHLAALFGLVDMATLLIEMGADVNRESEHVGRPIHQAMAGRQENLVRLLLARGVRDVPRSFPELRGKYLGLRGPGRTVQVFAPQILFPAHWPHGPLSFSRDGDEMFWAATAFSGDLEKIWSMKMEDGIWSPPRVVPFSRENAYFDGGPHLSPDGRRLYFHSSRPVAKNGEPRAPDIWFAERTPEGFGEIQNLGAPINTDGTEVNVSISDSGNLFFQSSDRAGGVGGSDIYFSKYVNGQFLEPENLGSRVNSLYYESGPFIAPDESYLIFHSNRPGGSSTGFELYVSFKKHDGNWSNPVSLGADINMGPTVAGSVSPDGKYLFFTNARHGSRAHYWVDAKVIEHLRAERPRSPDPEQKSDGDVESTSRECC